MNINHPTQTKTLRELERETFKLESEQREDLIARYTSDDAWNTFHDGWLADEQVRGESD